MPKPLSEKGLAVPGRFIRPGDGPRDTRICGSGLCLAQRLVLDYTPAATARLIVRPHRPICPRRPSVGSQKWSGPANGLFLHHTVDRGLGMSIPHASPAVALKRPVSVSRGKIIIFARCYALSIRAARGAKLRPVAQQFIRRLLLRELGYPVVRGYT